MDASCPEQCPASVVHGGGLVSSPPPPTNFSVRADAPADSHSLSGLRDIVKLYTQLAQRSSTHSPPPTSTSHHVTNTSCCASDEPPPPAYMPESTSTELDTKLAQEPCVSNQPSASSPPLASQLSPGTNDPYDDSQRASMLASLAELNAKLAQVEEEIESFAQAHPDRPPDADLFARRQEMTETRDSLLISLLPSGSLGPRSAKAQEIFIRNQMTHLGQEFICYRPRCIKSFKKVESLIRHMCDCHALIFGRKKRKKAEALESFARFDELFGEEIRLKLAKTRDNAT